MGSCICLCISRSSYEKVLQVLLHILTFYTMPCINATSCLAVFVQYADFRYVVQTVSILPRNHFLTRSFAVFRVLCKDFPPYAMDILKAFCSPCYSCEKCQRNVLSALLIPGYSNDVKIGVCIHKDQRAAHIVSEDAIPFIFNRVAKFATSKGLRCIFTSAFPLYTSMPFQINL